ncbi:MAG: hypothetical protein H5U21_05795 [Porphyrobacter sp.]|nr:hypothetical protein [Porphyrobacter sp.]
MLTSIRRLLAGGLLAGTVFAAAPAVAQDDSGITISGNAAIVSEYRFRGVDMSGGDIAVQGGVDIGHASGIYIGTWGSSLDEDTVGYGHTELDVYAGWSTELASGVSFDIGGIYYLYPNAGPGDYDYVEAYASAGFGFGPGDLSVGIAYAPEQESLGDTDNLYVFADAGVGIPNTALSLSGHLGYTDGFLTYTDDSKAFDWSVGADYALTPNLSVGVAYVGAEGDFAPGDYDFTDDTVVFTLGASF